MLDAKQRVRYARHRSLVELGDEGVLALLRAPIGTELADPRAESVRTDYLVRAGLVSEPRVEQEFGPSESTPVDIAGFAGAPYLEEAAAACLGALHAVARIRVAAGLAETYSLPDFTLFARREP